MMAQHNNKSSTPRINNGLSDFGGAQPSTRLTATKKDNGTKPAQLGFNGHGKDDKLMNEMNGPLPGVPTVSPGALALGTKWSASGKARKGDVSSSAFHRELCTLEGTLAELVAFCETSRHVHLKIKEDVARAAATFEKMKAEYKKAHPLLVPKQTDLTVQTPTTELFSRGQVSWARDSPRKRPKRKSTLT